MKQKTISINFRGGIISPGELLEILKAVRRCGIMQVRFGLRQQLLINIHADDMHLLSSQLDAIGCRYEHNGNDHPNIMSSYPAEEVFITDSWLSEGVYKDLFDLMDHPHRLKVNICDANQSFTPMLTGNINWVAAPGQAHYWYLFIRFPRTNVVYPWKDLVYTNDLPRFSRDIETTILSNHTDYVDNPQANGETLYSLMDMQGYLHSVVEKPLQFPEFRLPYYEGLNKYNGQYWLGIYRRDELFSIDFLKELCQICQRTRIGQFCSTPWKSIIVKGIQEAHRQDWNALLNRHQVNVRHAANELNFQVEDNSTEALRIKKQLVDYLSEYDTRTFGLCIGIKTKRKSEVFSNILIRKKYLFQIGKIGLFPSYDILCSKDFNPDERTGYIFSENNPGILLPEQFRRAVMAYYTMSKHKRLLQGMQKDQDKAIPEKQRVIVYQCSDCLGIYDEVVGDPDQGIEPGTIFKDLPPAYSCPTCASSIKYFNAIDRHSLVISPDSPFLN